MSNSDDEKETELNAESLNNRIGREERSSHVTNYFQKLNVLGWPPSSPPPSSSKKKENLRTKSTKNE
ncbi:hypothetical protein DERP_010101 [Dermatophagoides pteronyssinus]|uniref:Uncharacterized protein n=1 Tax=Dermatophagoides pteronyssinus TaxID=6956 RepID=A0ABQ8JEY2_DERPT|nr:hypothetical protein DERP_010101 [Dermatophagoides pteronyssinus]